MHKDSINSKQSLNLKNNKTTEIENDDSSSETKENSKKINHDTYREALLYDSDKIEETVVIEMMKRNFSKLKKAISKKKQIIHPMKKEIRSHRAVHQMKKEIRSHRVAVHQKK